jgi:hypothetical protein
MALLSACHFLSIVMPGFPVKLVESAFIILFSLIKHIVYSCQTFQTPWVC